MKRRGFLSALAGIGAVAAPIAAAITAPSSNPDTFSYRGWSVYWCGWVRPVNQCFTFGYWYAAKLEFPRVWVSTTLGRCGAYREMETIDTAREQGWPILQPWSTEDEKTAARERAWRLLKGTLDAVS
jgi:hypothetical protein